MGLAIGQVVPAPHPRGNTLLYKIPAPGTQGLTNPRGMPGGGGGGELGAPEKKKIKSPGGGAGGGGGGW